MSGNITTTNGSAAGHGNLHEEGQHNTYQQHHHPTGSANLTSDRNIKTAGNSRRVSSQVNSPPVGTSYDFNKIKKDLSSVRQRHEDIHSKQNNTTTSGSNFQHHIVNAAAHSNRNDANSNAANHNQDQQHRDQDRVLQ